jgi:hypothetical protein
MTSRRAHDRWPSFWCAYTALAIGTTFALSGCSNIPRYYVRMAEPEATLSQLTAHPEQFEGKVVLLGGTLIEEEADEQYGCGLITARWTRIMCPIVP